MDWIEDITEPGGREPAPTPGLRRLQAFVNTNDIEEERDEIGTPEHLGAWLASHGAIARDAAVPPDAHSRAMDVREGLRALARANNGEPLDQARVARLNAAAARLPMVATVEAPGRWALHPTEAGVDGFLADLLATMVTAMADGTWSRVKGCRNDTCRWLFYDHSRNRSGTWCTMAVCGSRIKARAYRARQREGLSA